MTTKKEKIYKWDDLTKKKLDRKLDGSDYEKREKPKPKPKKKTK